MVLCTHITLSSEPAGISAPEMVPVNSSTVRVLWSPPLQPNGAVTGYSIYLNDHLHGSVDNSSGSYLLGNLLPFTVYNVQVHTIKIKSPPPKPRHSNTQSTRCFCVFQVEVCTVYACVRSNITQTTTVEDLPADLAPPHAHVINPRYYRNVSLSSNSF